MTLHRRALVDVQAHAAERDVLGVVDHRAAPGCDSAILQGDPLDRHLRQAADLQGAVGTVADDVANGKIAKRRGALADRFGHRLPGDPVIHVDADRLVADVVHDDVGDVDVLDDPAAAARGFEAQADVRPAEEAVADRDVAHPAGHFAADGHSAVAAQDRAVADGDVFAGDAALSPGLVFPRFDADRVIAGVEEGVGDGDVAAGIHVQRVAVLRVPGVLDGDVADVDVFAEQQVQVPGGGVSESRPVEAQTFAAGELEEVGAEGVAGGGVILGAKGQAAAAQFLGDGVSFFGADGGVPDAGGFVDGAAAAQQLAPLLVGELLSLHGSPDFALTIEDAVAGDGDVEQIRAGDGREAADGLLALVVGDNQREIIIIAAEQHGRATLEVQLDIALQSDRPGEPGPARDDYPTSAGGGRRVDRARERVGVLHLAVAACPVVGDVPGIHDREEMIRRFRKLTQITKGF